MLAPFVIAFILAYILKRPIRLLSKKLHMNHKFSAILIVLLFYCTIGLLISLLGIKAFATAGNLIGSLPTLYEDYVATTLMGTFDGIEKSLLNMDASLVTALEDIFAQFMQALGQLVSNVSMAVMGELSGLASSLPGLFIKLLLMIISTFFIAADYDLITGFLLRQFSKNTKNLLFQIKKYVVGTLFVCIRSYALIMGITFLELTLCFTLIGIKNPLLIAFLIALFDILPVLGTGGIMLPWVAITALQGNYPLALALLVVYLVVTVIRNILEPKIVGSQIGLHPIVTLASMFLGAQLFGVVGLFGFPITLSLLRHLNDNGTIRLFKTEDTA